MATVVGVGCVGVAPEPILVPCGDLGVVKSGEAGQRYHTVLLKPARNQAGCNVCRKELAAALCLCVWLRSGRFANAGKYILPLTLCNYVNAWPRHKGQNPVLIPALAGVAASGIAAREAASTACWRGSNAL
jgi:hypothetical protein